MARTGKKCRLADCLKEILILPVQEEEDRAYLKELGIRKNHADNQMLIMARLAERAAKGDISAVREIRSVMQETEGHDSGLIHEIIEAVRNVG